MDTLRKLLRIPATLLLLASLSPATCHADEVSPLDLVNESVALCVEIPRLEATWSSFDRSRVASRLKTLPWVERFLTGPGFQKWKHVDESVAKITGKALSDQLLGLASDSLVLAVYLPDGKKPQGVVISRARDESSLKQALSSWSALEPQHVEQPKTHRGQPYVQRAKTATSAQVIFFTTFGRTLVLSDHEALVQQAIDFHIAAGEPARPATAVPRGLQTLRASPLFQSSRARLPKKSAAFLYVNARAWDGALDEAARRQSDVAGLARVWRSVASVAGALRLMDGVVVDLVAGLHPDERHSGWDDFANASKFEGSWSQRIPPDAVLAVSGRLDTRPLVKAWLSTIPESKRDEFVRGRHALQSLLLGRDLFDDVIPQVLRDWTICLSTPTEAADGAPPFKVVGFFPLESRAASEPSSDKPAIEKCLDNALQFGFNLAGAHLSQERGEVAVVDSEPTTGGTLRSLRGLPPWSPAYVVRSDRLAVASSKSDLLNELASPPVTPDSQNKRLIEFERQYFAGTSELVWLDSARVRDLLARHGDWLTRYLGAKSDEPKNGLWSRLLRSAPALNVFDAAFVAARLDDDHVRIVLGAALDKTE